MFRLSSILVGLSLFAACRGHRNDPIGPGWERLGTRMVNHRGDHDVILAGGQGTFRAIRIDVDRADLEMWDIVIHYGNGDSHRPGIRHHFREGSWSRTIDLPGGQRTVKSIEFWYRTAHRGEGRANVDVWGLH
jgi:hypothetical protein